ncbi:hypothetical protein N0V90_009069 [Kalmusia sp. IMI 367209]|nr:hypothetical protein N0V90_009069 [Kalmusia sp. IMI 367209]
MAYVSLSESSAPQGLDDELNDREIANIDSFHSIPLDNNSLAYIPLGYPSHTSQSQDQIELAHLVSSSKSEPSLEEGDSVRANSNAEQDQNRKKRVAFRRVRKPFLATRIALRRCFHNQSWRFGLFAGLYASIIVLVGNLVLLIYGSIANGGIVNGVGTISKGDAQSIERLSTGYHILINILSTILLTSSNYAMQLLCAPTRDEIDKAHAKDTWLDIGQVSLHNLSRVKRKRLVLWAILACSSAPLHLLQVDETLLLLLDFNSSVFELVTGQDYQITVVSNTTDQDYLGWDKLENKDWKRLYSTQYVSDYGDLHLVVDQVAFSMRLNENLTFALDMNIFNNSTQNAEQYCAWTSISTHQTEYSFPMTVDFSTRSLKPQDAPAGVRLEYPLSSPDNPPFPKYTWPVFAITNVSETKSIDAKVTLCPDKDWLLPAPLHISFAMAQKISDASKVQIALPFLLVVIVANITKINCDFVSHSLKRLFDNVNSQLYLLGNSFGAIGAQYINFIRL